MNKEKKKKQLWFYIALTPVFVFYLLMLVGGGVAMSSGGIDAEKGLWVFVSAMPGMLGIFLLYKRKFYGLAISVLSVIPLYVAAYLESDSQMQRDFSGILIAFIVPLIFAFILSFFASKSHQITPLNLLLCLFGFAFVCYGVATMQSTIGKGLFALGILWLINTVRMVWFSREI